MSTVPYLKEKYLFEIRDVLRVEFKRENIIRVGGPTRIVASTDAGEVVRDSKALENAIHDPTVTTGQKPATAKAERSIVQFKLREGRPIGMHVMLRGDRMWEFLDRLPLTAPPQIRDFCGLSAKQFDGHGNYTFGLTGQFIFHEIDRDSVDRIRGTDIAVVTSANMDEEGCALLRYLGFPFKGD